MLIDAEIISEKRSVSFHNESIEFVNSDILNFDLKTLLTTSPHGNTILKYYNENNTLNPSLRTKLVDIIARHIYNYICR